MEDVRGKYVSPAIDQLAFNCPHCGSLAKQFWFSVHADQLPRDAKPMLVTAEGLEEFKKSAKLKPEEHKRTMRWAERKASGRPFLEGHSQYREFDVNEVSISSCFNCNELCLWVHDQLLWPRRPGGPQPNLDLSPDVRRDYDEASAILDASPRGAAALLRLASEAVQRAW
jgi:hypothetical protein